MKADIDGTWPSKVLDGICARCGSSDNLHRDHVVPLARGGAHSIENYQTLCARCNVRKGASLEEEIREMKPKAALRASRKKKARS